MYVASLGRCSRAAGANSRGPGLVKGSIWRINMNTNMTTKLIVFILYVWNTFQYSSLKEMKRFSPDTNQNINSNEIMSLTSKTWEYHIWACRDKRLLAQAQTMVGLGWRLTLPSRTISFVTLGPGGHNVVYIWSPEVLYWVKSKESFAFIKLLTTYNKKVATCSKHLVI